MEMQKFEHRNKELEKEMKQERTNQEREFEVTISCKTKLSSNIHKLKGTLCKK